MTPKEAQMRNRVRCSMCGRFFRASRYLPKALIKQCKDEDAYGTRIYPGIGCSDCTKKPWFSDMLNEWIFSLAESRPKPWLRKGVSKRRWKIRKARYEIAQDIAARKEYYGE